MSCTDGVFGKDNVIVTSQNPLWPAGQGVGVPVLEASVAAGFLVSRAGAADTSAARDLARELGGLPLALEQAAAYMQATGLGVAGYLELFRERRLELLARGDPAGYDKRVTTTWALAFDRLQTPPQAAGLLRLLACCASEAIPLGLLLRPRPELAATFGSQVRPLLVPLLDDPLAVADALAALRRYSLVSVAADGAVSVHRLVQAVTLAQLPPETQAAWRRAAAALIEAALSDQERVPANWPAYAALMPHAQAALAAGSEGMAHVAGYLGVIGDHAAAIALSRRVLEARRADLGPEHPKTLNARVELAGWIGAEGTLPRRGTSSQRCCPPMSESSVPGTRTPWTPAPASRCSPGTRETPLRRVISWWSCCPSVSGCPGPSIRPPWLCGPSWRSSPGRRGTWRGRGTSTRRCYQSSSTSSDPSTGPS